MGISDLEKFRRNLIISDKNKQLRKLQNYYEYCLLKEYDAFLEFENAQAVQIGPVFANLVETNAQFIPVSIMFSDDEFDLDDVISWLNQYSIYYESSPKTNGKIERADEIIQGLKFKGNIIILYRKGRKKLEYDSSKFIEVTEQYAHYSEVRSVLNEKSIVDREAGLKICFNGVLVETVPRIDFEQENLIISNGTFICADYMDDYFGSVALFRMEDSNLPVAWIQDKNTTVYIDLFESDEFGQICVLKFAYELELSEL